MKENTKYTGDVESLVELEEMIDNLPDTIEYLSVQADLQHFQSKKVLVKPEPGWKERVKEIIKGTLTCPGGDQVDEFRLRCHYGGTNPTASYYLSIYNPEIRDFCRRMTAGEFGSLD